MFFEKLYGDLDYMTPYEYKTTASGDTVKELAYKRGVTPAKLLEDNRDKFSSINQVVPKGTNVVINQIDRAITSSEWDLYPNFNKEEFKCKCGCGLDNVSMDLVKVLEDIRSHFGDRKVTITSGARCDSNNRNAGGASKSRHLYGTAADIKISGVNANAINNYVTKLRSEGKVYYNYTGSASGYRQMDGIVHVDVGNPWEWRPTNN